MRKLCLILAILSLFSLACGKKKNNVLQPKEENTMKVSPVDSNNLTNATSTAITMKEDPLTRANKDYMIAYNKYVMLLRESGPQTIETLQALAEYQRKYKIYQMVKREQRR